MAIEWTISMLNYKIYDESLLKNSIVTSIDWIATKTSEGGIQAVKTGTVSIPFPEIGDSFVEFTDITKELATTWFDTAIASEKAAIETQLDSDLDALLNPVVGSDLPWLDLG